jgi:hypothetical protein
MLAVSCTVQAEKNAPTTLRSAGPAGLETFWLAHQAEIEAHKTRLRQGDLSPDARWQALKGQLDTIAGQHDAWASRLFWFTDLNQAKNAARAQHKPILSLRLLGKLTDEYSCANSRFFRTALYSNTQISQTLRDKFILHWSSERPVPVVTIDMGDGRRLKRTLTGNSAHYLLDSEGRPLDVLPGLYGPGAFHSWLERGEALFIGCAEGAERGGKLKAWHEAELNALADAYINDIKARTPNWKEQVAYRESVLKGLKNTALLDAKAAAIVAAPIAGSLAVSKAILEAPVLNVTALYNMNTPFTREQVAYWGGLTPYLEKSRLDENSRLLLRSQRAPLDNLAAPEEGPAAANGVAQIFLTGATGRNFSGRRNQAARPPADPFERLVDKFERSMAVDTQRNEWNFHAPLHQWFATHEVNDFEELNRMVYDKLFLTPETDPWLGLSPAGTYTGLREGGLFETSDARPLRQASAQ